MCDSSLQAVASRPAVVGETLVTKNFGSGTSGFAPATGEDVAVCLLPGTEVAFDENIMWGKSLYPAFMGALVYDTTSTKVGRFVQIKKDERLTHHDALELPSGEVILLHWLKAGQKATVLQLPAAPKTAEEAKEQQRLEVVG